MIRKFNNADRHMHLYYDYNFNKIYLPQMEFGLNLYEIEEYTCVIKPIIEEISQENKTIRSTPVTKVSVAETPVVSSVIREHLTNNNEGSSGPQTQERGDTCLNNINLNVNLSSSGFTKEKLRQSQPQRRYGLDCTYTKKSRDKLLQGSLENISSNPFGEFDTQQSTLRRSRSLAISRESLFTSLDIPPTNHRQRRHQLIPRAKLIDRNGLKDRRNVKERGQQQETFAGHDRPIIRKKSSISSELTFPQLSYQNNPSIYQSSANSTRRTSLENPPYHLSALLSTGNPHSESLTPHYYNKPSLHDRFRDTRDNLDHRDCGLSLPNYYPDSRCETDISLTDISLIDTTSIKEESSQNEKLLQADNQSTNNLFYRENSSPECITNNLFYHDNISFGKNLLDDFDDTITKPRTIRQYTPQIHENDHFYGGKPRSLPNYSILFDEPVNHNIGLHREENIYDTIDKSDDNLLKSYEELEAKLSLNRSQSDVDFDEINLQDILLDVNTTENGDINHDECYVVENLIYDEIENWNEKLRIESEIQNKNIEVINTEDLINNNLKVERKLSAEEQNFKIVNGNIKTRVQVPGENRIYSVVNKADKDKSEDYKTVVSVDENPEEENTKEKSPKESKRHSHNYLKEFLESQKGSKKPLQNFLSKKISRAFGEPKKLSTESNLENNQYHSLPDLSIGNNLNNLRQCEKIDRKLRKCEKTIKTPSNNRFIVNIGRHFDVTAESNIPVDFEVKISKLPKSKKSKNSKSGSSKHSEHKQQLFINAVKSLNQTIHGVKLDDNQNEITSEVIEGTTKTEPKLKNSSIKRLNQPKYRKNRDSSSEKLDKSKIKPLPKISEAKESEELPSMDPQSHKEYQEKVGTMRNYWGKLAQPPEENETADKCKIVDVQTKVEDVIKKFEPKEEEEKVESIVNATKQLFEPKLSLSKAEKLSPFVKESCGLFENPAFDKSRFSSSNQFESLNPNVVEIIEQNSENIYNTTDDEKYQTNLSIFKDKENLKIPERHQHQTVMKSKSVTIEPEFDHVRYRVMKSNMFQKNIFAKCQQESQFNGLMQYLQDYSFQELLIDNNIVIIEPIRSNVPHETSHNAKSAQNITNFLHKQYNGSLERSDSTRRRFFYHPIRVNKEMNEDELPNPDTVKQVRLMFESGLKKCRSSQGLDNITRKTIQYQTIESEKDVCSANDSDLHPSSDTERGNHDNFDANELCCEQQYISEDVMQKIRQCGTSVTYYGGKVLNKDNEYLNPMTRTIMDEIKKQTRECNCKKTGTLNSILNLNQNENNKESYHGIKFKLLKSNSCSSRLELVGTKNLSSYKQKFLEKQKFLLDQKNNENQEKNNDGFNENEEAENENSKIEKNEINRSLTSEAEESDVPKIIGTTGKRMIQWGTPNEDKTFNINFSKNNQKALHNFHNYQQVKSRVKKIDDMEFEPYEIAGN